MSLTKIHRSSSTLIIIPFMVPELCSLNHCKMAHLWSSCPNDGTFVVFLSQRWHICGRLVPTMAYLWSSCPNDGTFVVFLSQRKFVVFVPNQENKRSCMFGVSILSLFLRFTAWILELVLCFIFYLLTELF